MKRERMIQVVRLQENLASFRKIAGWTSEELGYMLGVSKQNISNLENANTTLSQAQYVAIRHFLDYQTVRDPANTTLPLMVYLLLDRLDIVGREYRNLMGVAKDIAAASVTMSGKTLHIFTTTLLKATYTLVSDHSEVDSTIKDALRDVKPHDWTADIFADTNQEKEDAINE